MTKHAIDRDPTLEGLMHVHDDGNQSGSHAGSRHKDNRRQPDAHVLAWYRFCQSQHRGVSRDMLSLMFGSNFPRSGFAR